MNSAQPGVPGILTVSDSAAWRTWLDANEEGSEGVWLMLAKKGTLWPTSLSYAEALDEALCSGWIDGQKKGHDEAVFLQRFTPRRARSLWSQRNVEHAARLIQKGRMRPRGLSEIDRAKADGRWERAYAGAASAEPPADLIAALSAHEGALERFAALSSAARYSVLFPLLTAPDQAIRARRLERAVAQLAGLA